MNLKQEDGNELVPSQDTLPTSVVRGSGLESSVSHVLWRMPSRKDRMRVSSHQLEGKHNLGQTGSFLEIGVSQLST